MMTPRFLHVRKVPLLACLALAALSGAGAHSRAPDRAPGDEGSERVARQFMLGYDVGMSVSLEASLALVTIRETVGPLASFPGRDGFKLEEYGVRVEAAQWLARPAGDAFYLSQTRVVGPSGDSRTNAPWNQVRASTGDTVLVEFLSRGTRRTDAAGGSVVVPSRIFDDAETIASIQRVLEWGRNESGGGRIDPDEALARSPDPLLAGYVVQRLDSLGPGFEDVNVAVSLLVKISSIESLADAQTVAVVNGLWGVLSRETPGLTPKSRDEAIRTLVSIVTRDPDRYSKSTIRYAIDRLMVLVEGRGLDVRPYLDSASRDRLAENYRRLFATEPMNDRRRAFERQLEGEAGP